MPVQIPEAANTTQNNWRFCVRCLSLFWNGRRDNGHCPHPAGGAHQAMSWDFYLPADPEGSVNQRLGQFPTGP
ncbi:hypothetical protein SAMN04490220_0684 [Rhodococcus jostii]|uniref:Uncharacterized protein n=1 Tax=Rhodococcus jostii TaxID=132919 RepID=A0A1H4J7E3_RHOJO|nr:hypothetical protein SAMN04490220_0684 [Rhodococcus jostii]